MGLVLTYVYLLIILSVVSLIDLKRRKIRNLWSLVNVLNYLAFLFLLENYYVFSWQMFAFPLVFFVVSFALFTLKIMGAGDSKFISTFYLTVPVGHHEELFMIQAGITVFVGIFLLALNTISNFANLKYAYIVRDLSVVRKVYGKKFPYSPVILMSWLIWGFYYGRALI